MPAATARSTRDDSPEAAARAVREEDAPPAAPKKGRWQALANLSIGRDVTSKEKSADIIERGGIVELTEEQAHGFLTRHRIPVIRRVSEQNQALPRVTARDLFGKQPGAEQFGARPDPAGASRIVTNEEADVHPADPENAPEAHDPQVDLSVDPDAAKDK